MIPAFCFIAMLITRLTMYFVLQKRRQAKPPTKTLLDEHKKQTEDDVKIEQDEHRPSVYDTDNISAKNKNKIKRRKVN